MLYFFYIVVEIFEFESVVLNVIEKFSLNLLICILSREILCIKEVKNFLVDIFIIFRGLWVFSC